MAGGRSDALLPRSPGNRLLGRLVGALLDVALARGYATRIGLEDVLTLPDGPLAPDNAALLRPARDRVTDPPSAGPHGAQDDRAPERNTGVEQPL